jgi:hypothetical protein
MDQEQYNDLYSKEAIVEAIENVSDLLTAMSGTDTAISVAMEDVSDMLVSLDDRLITLTSSVQLGFEQVDKLIASPERENNYKMLSWYLPGIADSLSLVASEIGEVKGGIDKIQPVQHDNGSAALQTKQQQSSAKVQSDVSAIAGGVAKLVTKLDAIYDNVNANDKHKNDASFLQAALDLLKFVVDDKNAKKFKKNSEAFSAGITLLIKPVETLLKAYSEIKDAAKALDAVTDLFDSMGKSIQKSSRAIVLIVGATIAMTAAIALMDWQTIGKFIVVFPVLCGALATGMFILSKASGGKDMQNIRDFALGIGILSAALLLFEHIEWDAIQKGAVAFAILGSELALTMRLLPSKAIAKFGKDMLMLTVSVALMGAAIVGMSYLIQNIPYQQLLKGAGIMLIAGGVIWLASKIMVKGADDIGKSFGWIALGLAAFGMALVVFQELIQDIEWKTWALAGASILALAGAAWLVGKNPMTWAGVAGIFAIVGAVAAVPFAVELYSDLSWDDLAKPGAAIAVLVGALYVAGINPKMEALGAAAILAGSAALVAFGVALQMFPTDIDWESFGKIGAVVGGLIAALYAAGAGAKFTILGATALIAGSASLIIFASALNKWPRDLSWEDLGKIGTVVGGLCVALYAAGAGSAMTLLGAAALIAGAGALVILAKAFKAYPWKIQQKDYENLAFGIMKVAGSIALIGNPLTYIPLMAGIGAAVPLGGALYSLSKGLVEAAKVDVSKAATAATAIVKWAKDSIKIIADVSIKDAAKAGFGLAPFKQLGSALASLAIAVNLMANGIWKEYDAKGNVVAVHNIGPEQYAAFGVAVQQLVDAITVPLQNFGKGGGFLRDSDAKKGMDSLKHIDSIVNPMIEIAKESEKVKKCDYSGFAKSVQSLINGVKKPLEDIGKGSAWYKSNDFETGAKVLAKLEDAIKPVLSIAQQYDAIKATNFTYAGKQITAFVNAIVPTITGLGAKEDDLDTGIAAFKKLAEADTPMNDLLTVATAYSKFTAEQQKAMSNTMSAIVNTVQVYLDEDAKMPQDSKIASNLERVKNAFNDLDSPNLRLIVETAKAIDSIANANLSHVAEAKSEVAKMLFKRLDNITAQLVVISKNTKPKETVAKVQYNEQSGRLTYAFGNNGYEADFTTIAMQLDQLIGLVQSQQNNSLFPNTGQRFGLSIQPTVP